MMEVFAMFFPQQIPGGRWAFMELIETLGHNTILWREFGHLSTIADHSISEAISSGNVQYMTTHHNQSSGHYLLRISFLSHACLPF
jgi:hypothetical protein